jgi:hypothetical protein
MIESTRDLAAALNISSASQIKATVPDTAMAVSAKTRYVFGSGMAINRYSVFLLVSAEVKNEARAAKSAVLKKDVAKRLAADPKKYLDQFRVRCGDEYLAGVTTGGEFRAVIEVQTDSEEERHQLAAEIASSVAVESLAEAGRESKIEATLKRVATDKQVKIWSFQRGGNGADATPPATVDEMIARARAMPEIVSKPQAARTLSATFQDYTTLELDLPTDYVKQLAAAKRTVAQIGAKQGALLDRRADVDYILAHPSAFAGLDAAALAELTKAKANMDGQLKKLYEAAQICFTELKGCTLPAGMEPPKFQEPERLDASLGQHRGLLVAVTPRNIRPERMADDFSSPECFVRVAVTDGAGAGVTVVQSEIFENCALPELALETSTERVEGLFGQLGIDAESARLEVSLWEADSWYDDLIGATSVSYSELRRKKKAQTGISGEAAVLDVSVVVGR